MLLNFKVKKMKNSEEIKEMVKQKYSELLYRTKNQMNLPVVDQAVAAPKCTTSCPKITMN